MKTKTYSFIIVGLLFFSCNSNNSEESESTKNNEPNKEEIMEDPEFVIVKEYPMDEWGGAQPELTLRESGNAWLITEVPPFEDEDGNELFDDEDFPEGLEFEKLIADYIGTDVIRDDREVFIIENATEEQCLKVVEFFANYWDLRKEEYKMKKEN
ncbi:hypothetical protein K6119_10615 [Paracrocinitomix mangrovi]|uniref:hypothetical protein n=1 Tax=Paracrocinitomix mangrovi TaxID=2862509 RepID=UPI001C8D5F44|nr:hypothetical protein [Paracrocinitomix mangrovi]UKN00184.1 hypothetical protein K6119_10615 [Paracrocinitomix mangrovi]